MIAAAPPPARRRRTRPWWRLVVVGLLAVVPAAGAPEAAPAPVVTTQAPGEVAGTVLRGGTVVTRSAVVSGRTIVSGALDAGQPVRVELADVPPTVAVAILEIAVPGRPAVTVTVPLGGPGRDELALVSEEGLLDAEIRLLGFDDAVAGAVPARGAVYLDDLPVVVCDIDAALADGDDAPWPTPPGTPSPEPSTSPSPSPSPDVPPDDTAYPAPGPAMSMKKGVASYAYLQHDVARISALTPVWAYTWGHSRPVDTADMEFVPMVWGGWSVTPEIVAELTAGGQQGRYTTLLGFNEPDLREQSNMSPEEAIRLWPQLEATGLRLVSPAPASPWNGWLDRFMELAAGQGRRVDAVALHYYQDFTHPDAVRRLEAELTAIHDRYRRPLWITEIGAIDIRGWGVPMYAEPTPDAAESYMREVVALLERLPFVERYAWFDDNCWHAPECRTSSLYDGEHRLTRHGTLYASLAPAPVPVRSVTTFSSVETLDWGRSRVVDGLTRSAPGSRGFSSEAHRSPDATESLTVDLQRARPVTEVVLHPRSAASDEWPGDSTDGAGFPADFHVDVSDDGATWRTVRSIVDHPGGPGPHAVTFTPTSARYVRVVATRLARPTTSESAWGGYRFQLAELMVRGG